jgi:hypothetical protein
MAVRTDIALLFESYATRFDQSRYYNAYAFHHKCLHNVELKWTLGAT